MATTCLARWGCPAEGHRHTIDCPHMSGQTRQPVMVPTAVHLPRGAYARRLRVPAKT